MSIALKSPNLAKPSLNLWWWGLLLIITIFGLAYLAYNQFVVVPRQQAQRKVETALVTRTMLTLSILANGTVQPERSVNVSLKVAGILKQLLVKEGDIVQKGQVLAYMDNSNLLGQLRQAQGTLDAAQANLNRVIAGNRYQDIAQAKARLQDAQFALRQTNNDFQRNQMLGSLGAISKQVADNAATTRNRAQAQVKPYQEAMALAQAGARPEDIDQARAQVTSAQGARQIIQANLNDTVIRAAFSGVVARKFSDPGAFVTPTTAGSSASSATSSSILSMASTNQVVAQVAQANIAQIHNGLVAAIQADAYPGKTFTGRVTQIATQADVVQNVTSFEVKTSVADPQHLLRSGMNVNVTFNAGQLDHVLVVLTGAIVQQNHAQGVFVTKDKGDPDPIFVPIVVVIHDAAVAAQTSRIIHIQDGVIVETANVTKTPGDNLYEPTNSA